jgi:hypothetical protein
MATTTDLDADAFVQLDITTDETTLGDEAIDALRLAWTDWEPNDGDMEVVQIETLAAMFANAAQLASQMPMAALIAYGTKLLGVPFGTGQPATTTCEFTVEDSLGYTIPANSQISIDGYAFNLVSDLVFETAGATTLDALVSAAENSSDYNGLVGANVVGISTPAFVTNIVVDAPTSGGVDPQSDADYAGDLSLELTLTSRAIITLPNFETAAVAVPGIERAYAQTDSGRNVTVTLVGDGGTLVSDAIKDQLAAIYQANRLVNVTVALDDPTFTPIDVDWHVVAYLGYDADDLTARINGTLEQVLSPQGWGISQGSSGMPSTVPDWTNDTTVRGMKLVQVIGDVPGVNYVEALSINGGANFADFTMPGAVALPTPGTFTGTVDQP